MAAACCRSPLRLLLWVPAPRALCSRNVHLERGTAEALYPPVVPSRTAKSKSAKRRLLLESFEHIRTLEPQEKIRALTRIQRMKYVVYPQSFAQGADQWYQHLTRTAYLPELPPSLSRAEPQSEPLLPGVSALVRDALLQERRYLKRSRTFLQKEQQQTVEPFITNVVSALINSLNSSNPLLQLSSLDMAPHVNFYWINGEKTFLKGHRRGRVEPQRFQINDRPHNQIRIPQQLPEFVPLEAEVKAEVPVIQYAPDVLPLFQRQYDNNISIGAKLQDPCCYGHTQFHVVHNKFHRNRLIKKNLADQIEVFLRANAIASLFAWTGAQAMYQGFWSEQDLSRPFVAQAVITDGQYFSFFCYQLNTLALSSLSTPNNPRKNLCWGTESLPLFERITDGEVIGWNDNVIKLLVQFLLNKP